MIIERLFEQKTYIFGMKLFFIHKVLSEQKKKRKMPWQPLN